MHQLFFSDQTPDVRPLHSPQSLEMKEYDTRIEASAQGRPWTVILPQFTQIPAREGKKNHYKIKIHITMCKHVY